MDRRVRAGFVGCGSHASTSIYPTLRYVDVELVATCDLKEALAKRNARDFGALRYYVDYNEMFAREDLDAAFVVVGPQMHAQIAIDALKAGLHVFIEKPPCSTLEEAHAMLRVSKQANRYIMVGFMKRFATAYQIVKRLLDENRLGKITMISGKFCSGPYQESRMFVLDYAIHHLDLVRYFAGDVKRLYAEKCELGPGKISIAVNLQSVDGTVGALSLSSCESWTRHNERLEIIGDENFVIVDEKLRVLYYPKEDWIDLSDPEAEFGKRALGQGFFWEPNPPIPAWENQSLYTNGYFGEIKHFIDCIQSNREPAPSMVDGLRAMELVHALQMSVENQRIVELEQ